MVQGFNEGRIVSIIGQVQGCEYMMMSQHGCTFCIIGPLCRDLVDSQHKGSVMQSFDGYVVIIMDKLLYKQQSGQWNETP